MSKGAPKNDRKISSNAPGKKGKAVTPSNFSSTLISTIPHSRKGKHNLIVAMILEDLDKLEPEKALLVPLESLHGEKMENVRSALNRATRQKDNCILRTCSLDHLRHVGERFGNRIAPRGRGRTRR